MSNSKINITDVDKVNQSINKIKALNQNIENYINSLKSLTAGMSEFWKDAKYNSIKQKFDMQVQALNQIKQNTDNISEEMNEQISKAEDILNLKI